MNSQRISMNATTAQLPRERTSEGGSHLHWPQAISVRESERAGSRGAQWRAVVVMGRQWR
jgi:hypothetical protein